MSSFTKTLIVDCDGGGDSTTIKEAADDLISTGGVIIVEEGTYTIDGNGEQTTIKVPSNTTIIGRGNVIINVTNYNIPLFQNKGQDASPDMDNDRIVISGFTIKLDPSGSNYNKNLIDFKQVSNSVIEKLYIIMGESPSYGVVSGNAAIKFQGVDEHLCEGNVISECIIEDYGYDNDYGHGIFLESYCEGNTITNNTINECDKNIYLKEAQKNIVSCNISLQAKDEGIKIEKSDYTGIEGNEVYDNTDYGIYIDQCTGCSIQSNVCYNNDNDGIYLFGTSTESYHVKYNTIVSNICHENGTDSPSVKGNGIYLGYYSKRNVLSGNTCYKNEIYGIREESKNNGAENNIISTNVCYENKSDEIYVIKDAEGEIEADTIPTTTFMDIY